MVVNQGFWKNKNVFVTGHTGFKGSWLCLWLVKMGANVGGISLSKPVSKPSLFSVLGLESTIEDNRGDIVYSNVCSSIIKKFNPEIIFHLAAQPLVRESYINPILTYKTNVIGTANVLESIRDCDSVKSIVVITTDKCYENNGKNYAYEENDSLGGYDPYSSSKSCAEHVALAYYRSFFKEKGIGLATARAGNVIGGGDWSSDRLIPDAVKKWSKNEKLIIRYPHASRPWQHVLEPLSGYLTLARHLKDKPSEFSGSWNFGPDEKGVKTVADTIELAAEQWGIQSEWKFSNRDNWYEAEILKLNSKKASSFLGWNPRMDFEKSVSETIFWYKEFYGKNPEMKALTLNQIEQYENFRN